MEATVKRGPVEWSKAIGEEFATAYGTWKETHCQDCFVALTPHSETPHVCARNPTTVKNAIMQEFLRVQRELLPKESVDVRYFALVSATNDLTTRMLAKRTQHRISAEKSKRTTGKKSKL